MRMKNASPLRLLAEFLLIVGIAETALTLLLPLIAPAMTGSVAAAVHAGLLSLLLAPVLYWRFLVKPDAVQSQPATLSPLSSTSWPDATDNLMARAMAVTNNSVIITDARNCVLWINPAFTRAFGWTLEQALGKPAGSLRHFDQTDPDAVKRVHEALGKGENIRLQTFGRYPDGSGYWLDSDIQALRAEDGSYAGYLAVETDVTEAKNRAVRLQSALMETQALMDTLNLHTIVSQANGRGVITQVNEEFCRLSGYTEEELVGCDHRIVNSGFHTKEFWQEFWKVISTGMPWRGQICNRAKDGSLFWVDSMIAPFIGDDGKIEKFISIRTDISQSKRYEMALDDAREKAEHATQSKGQFLANMSHEIRTPMNAILGMLKLLHGTDLSPRQLDYAIKAEGATRSLLGLINDILDFSKVEAGKMSLEIQPFRLSDLTRDLAVILSANVGSKGIEVLYDISPQLPDVLLGDAMRLQQVLINLGGNAVKFTSQGQVVISIRVKAMDAEVAEVEFAVQDSGIGIAPENQAHIFTGFSQAEASTSRKFGGTGLGLAISQRLVHLMNGDLQLQSALGQGSTFSFCLKLPLAQTLPEDMQLARVEPPAPHRVLVVDDNPIAAQLMAEMVRSWGWPVESVGSGEEVIARVHCAPTDGAFPFDVVYLDWHMEGMDGWMTAKWIRDECTRTQVKQPVIVMVSANNRDSLSQRTQEEQEMLNGFLVKPITISMLQEAALESGDSESRLRQAKRSGSSSRRLTGMHILVVEDNLINQQVAEELLMSQGAVVSLAADGRAGVNAVAAAKSQFDVVLMDVQMPVMDGYTATRTIRNELGLTTLPIVAMTANAMASDREACLAVGMNDHIAKPFDLAKLVQLLLQVTGFKPVSEDVLELPIAPTQAPVVAIKGLDTAGALARMGGLSALYLRSLRDFAKMLPTVEQEFMELLPADLAKAGMQMHTLKGTSSTLGANELSALAARLEKMCKQGAAVEEIRLELPNLHQALQQTMEAVDQAANAMANQPIAPQTVKDSPVAPLARNTDDARQALLALEVLLSAQDMSALEKFAQIRELLGAALPGAQIDPLEEALQSLEFEEALEICRALLDSQFS